MLSTPFFRNSLAGMWLACLVIAAVAPDLDYVVPWLDKGHYSDLRISHSLMFGLWVPGLLGLGLRALGVKGKPLIVMAAQSYLCRVLSSRAYW